MCFEDILDDTNNAPSSSKEIKYLSNKASNNGDKSIPLSTSNLSASFDSAQGTIWEAINGSHMLTRLKAPGSLESRWLTEDIPYGIGLWSKLGRQYGVISPVMDSLVNLGSVVMESDGWNEGRSLEDLGIANLNGKELKKYLDSGE